MADEPVSLPMLVELVNERADGGLERLDVARRVSEQVMAASDELLGFFVDEARGAGESWTAIGHRLHVSKQAARQRVRELAPAPRPNSHAVDASPGQVHRRRRPRGDA